MRLYRIISLETFIDILHNKRERYVRPATWEDTFEGYLYSKLYDAEERKKIIRDIYYNVCPRNYKAKVIPSVEHLCALSKLLNVHMEDLLVLQGESVIYSMIDMSDDSTTKRLLTYAKHLQKVA